MLRFFKALGLFNDGTCVWITGQYIRKKNGIRFIGEFLIKNNLLINF